MIMVKRTESLKLGFGRAVYRDFCHTADGVGVGRSHLDRKCEHKVESFSILGSVCQSTSRSPRECRCSNMHYEKGIIN